MVYVVLSDMARRGLPGGVSVSAGWCCRWFTASCQRHRDTTLIGTPGASVHHGQPAPRQPLKSCHFSPALGSTRLRWRIWPGPRTVAQSSAFPPASPSPTRRDAQSNACDPHSPFTHTSLMMREEMLSNPGLYFPTAGENCACVCVWERGGGR